MAELFTVKSIGNVVSPYKEKFGIPRQPGLATAATGYIELDKTLEAIDMVDGLNKFSHIWLIFMFHQTIPHGWKAKVKPPRLGGNQKLGVLATRSTFRPNGIGMSVVKLEGVEVNDRSVRIKISGFDLVDQTPIVDIKPYIAYSDAVIDANSDYADKAPEELLTVLFSEQADEVLANQADEVKLLIEQVLAQDPRPAYKHHKPDDKTYGVHLFDFNISFTYTSRSKVKVMSIKPV
ncbi:tRNA (N6-threonylcarbamoyladenosine(37)-N6)-methyltransferase TrmO [Thalassotalea sp. M1531]|uniref:tRNA (N6-threonylcarbamoyladenosine(37)-N6)-methyltransferase TrmO n=1 Tax=Thalassotalea algicola TaxID=2716224 RepID=A0A7Y0LFX2_9GAMM|nr:tRNA (N6-threonylcarbamoyladenosine(37)-N6)-methyltransferase TrmO [Thalassotalea algicola]NMP33417.1 tRNA (N6-threonylcarbamoyladenosine(37)-N6)-methyltransferase TrmO [Thalassotalea algicola]